MRGIADKNVLQKRTIEVDQELKKYIIFLRFWRQNVVSIERKRFKAKTKKDTLFCDSAIQRISSTLTDSKDFTSISYTSIHLDISIHTCSTTYLSISIYIYIEREILTPTRRRRREKINRNIKKKDTVFVIQQRISSADFTYRTHL